MNFPCDIEIEKTVLGCLIAIQNSFTNVEQNLSEDCFFEIKHKKIFKILQHLNNQLLPIDLLTVCEEIKKNQLMSELSFYFVANLTSNIGSALHLLKHSQTLIELSLRRKMMLIGQQLTAQSSNQANDIFNLIDSTSEIIYNTVNFVNNSNLDSIYDEMIEFADELAVRQQNNNRQEGITTGFDNVDEVINGLVPSTLTIIAARPGMGKTGLIISMIIRQVYNHNLKIGVFSLEMSKKQIISRIFAQIDGLNSNNIKRADLSNNQWDMISEFLGRSKDIGIYVDDEAGLSVQQLRLRARRMKQKFSIDALYVDYLQLAKCEDIKNREQEIAQISRNLIYTAKELNIPVIALSQLNRSVENRPGARPKLSDLRESGAIEQDANTVVFMWRPEYYNINEDENGMSTKGRVLLDFAKNREGGNEEIWLNFVAEKVQFTNEVELLKPENW